MKKLALLVAAFVLCSCATSSEQVQTKSLLTLRETIINSRAAITEPCQKGIMPKDECVKFDDYYQQSKKLYDTAVDAQIVMLTTGDTTKATESTAALSSLVGNMTTLLIKYNIGGAK